ncbi:MAG: YidC/Oxa1 family membrane protein insertase [Candidatus Magasanikbacteria bacterium]|nr:YidC/Oxa1 family membrane protein insertase [Candidatus Magasanikbacteria bacterium]
MQELFQAILYQPIFNALVALYNVIPDVGVGILIITIIIKFALYPLTNISLKSQKKLTDIQPKLAELKKKYKDDKQTLAAETMKMYKESNVNPLSSCLPMLLQLPVFLALFWVLKDSLGTTDFSLLYSFVSAPEVLDPMSLGFIDLSKSNIVLAVLAGAAQFWQAKMMQTKKAPKVAGEGAKDENMLSSMNKQMLYFMPVLTVIIGMQLAGGVALYWFLSTLLTALQQLFILKRDKKSEVEVIS